MKEEKICQNCKNKFIIEDEDFDFYEKIKVPPPTWCPECRRLRRFGWHGYYVLYKRPCAWTGDEVISTYHSDLPYKIYKQDIWWSDKWDPKSYGVEYDFSKPFFEQYEKLLKRVPLPALHTEQASMLNSEYCNAAAEMKNCYLCFHADRSENCGYMNGISFIKDSFDLTLCTHNELCYQGLNLNRCYRVFFSSDCSDSRDIYFSKDLIGCSDCFGCIGLRNKSFYIFNQPHSKEEYKEKIKEFDLSSLKNIKNLKKKAAEHFLKFPHRNFHTIKAYDSSGDYLFNCKNVNDSYWVDTAEDVRYSQFLQALNSAKCYDYSSFSLNAEWVYECTWVGINTSNVKFTFWNYSAHDIEYCYGCHASGNLFGCVGIRNGEYCILNKQYSKEEYQELVEKIKEQMMSVPYKDVFGRIYKYGEFFPNELCPWKYNETRGQEYFPMTKEKALENGFSWRDSDVREYRDATIQVPDNIGDVSDDILSAILKCINCGKNFRIIRMELDFYRRMNFPIPEKCQACRHVERICQLNSMSIYDRICSKCNRKIKTSYAPDRPEIVYCEQCYQKEVI